MGWGIVFANELPISRCELVGEGLRGVMKGTLTIIIGKLATNINNLSRTSDTLSTLAAQQTGPKKEIWRMYEHSTPLTHISHKLAPMHARTLYALLF